MSVDAFTQAPAGTSLSWLLDPVTVERFIDEAWAKSHLLIRRDDRDYFHDLFSAAAAEDFLEYSRPEESAVRLVRRAQNLDGYRLADGALDLVRVRNAFAEGYTMVLNGLERYVPAIAEVARTIELELNFETQVNAYVTPPRSQGFLPHYDDHDVLILQIEGSKTWHIYEADTDVPPHELRRRDSFVAGDLPPPEQIRLRSGEVLYIPRGSAHAAEADAEASIHLTVGIHPPTVLTLATHALHALSHRDDRLLATLPPRYLAHAATRESLDALVRDVLEAAGEPLALAEGLAVVEDALVRRGRCRPAGQLVGNAVEAEWIRAQSQVVKCGPLLSRVMAMDGGVALQFAHSLVKAGSDHRAAFLFLSRTSAPFRVAELPDLSEAQQVELARRLVLDGFLVRLPDD